MSAAAGAGGSSNAYNIIRNIHTASAAAFDTAKSQRLQRNIIIGSVATTASSMAIDTVINSLIDPIYTRCIEKIASINSRTNTNKIVKEAAKAALAAFNEFVKTPEMYSIAQNILDTTQFESKYINKSSDAEIIVSVGVVAPIITEHLASVWLESGNMYIPNVWEVIGGRAFAAAERTEVEEASRTLSLLRTAQTTTNKNMTSEDLLAAATLEALETSSPTPATVSGANRTAVNEDIALSVTNTVLQLAKAALFQKLQVAVYNTILSIGEDKIKDVLLVATVASFIALAQPETWVELATAVNKTVNRNTEHTEYGTDSGAGGAAGGAGAGAGKTVMFGNNNIKMGGGRRRSTRKRTQKHKHKRKTHRRRATRKTAHRRKH